MSKHNYYVLFCTQADDVIQRSYPMTPPRKPLSVSAASPKLTPRWPTLVLLDRYSLQPIGWFRLVRHRRQSQALNAQPIFDASDSAVMNIKIRIAVC